MRGGRHPVLALLMLLAIWGWGCDYEGEGLQELRCYQEGLVSQGRVCREGFWVGTDAGGPQADMADMPDACQPQSCEDVGATCGHISDGCGAMISCGECTDPSQTCQANQCVCQPKSCQELMAEGVECGQISDGCGAMIDCGMCAGAQEQCEANQCVCQPKSCQELMAEGVECGAADDGCGARIDCGPCTGPGELCGVVAANQCDCQPWDQQTFCLQQGKDCGMVTAANNCGQMVTFDCGTCTGEICGSVSPNVCGCPCNIEGTCYAAGAVNPANECEVCDPGRDASSWSPAAPATACTDDQLPCTDDVCRAGVCQHELQPDRCLVSNVCYGAGETDGTGCQVCEPSSSTTQLEPLQVNASCDAGGGQASGYCDAGLSCQSCQSQENACDGLDEDCSGAADDGLSQACALQQGVCAGSAVSCAAGIFPACTAADYGLSYQASETSCDDTLDNDCDGQTDCFDTDCAGTARCDTFCSPEGSMQPCLLQQGVCANSTGLCTNNTFSGCTAADYGADYEASEAGCDGLDNDCDGVTDEGCS